MADSTKPEVPVRLPFNGFRETSLQREAILDVLGKVDELADQIKAGVVEAKKDFGT